jgi:hypothetical protein
MKRLLLALCLVVPLANAIQVNGEGSTFEEAKLNAFRTAIEFEAGSIVVSERDSINYKLIKNDILVYSSAYITNYKIINSFKTGNKVQVVIDVDVASNKIADRILGIGSKPAIVESKHDIQYQTYMENKNNGDRILLQVLKDYPTKAFTVTQGNHILAVDVYRNAILEIPLEFKWNYNYITSLNDTLSALEDGSYGLFRPSPGNITIMAKDPKDYVFGKKSIYKFNDVLITQAITDTFLGNPPRIQLTITGRGNVVYKNCFVPESFVGKRPGFFNAESNLLILYGNQVEKNIIKLELRNMPTLLRDAEKIELAVVAHKSCL